MTATTRLEVQVAAQKAIATLDEIKAKAQGAESAFAKLQKATSGGFDRLEAALGKVVTGINQLNDTMSKLGGATARVGSASRDAASQMAQMQRAMVEETRAAERATAALEKKNNAALHRQDKANEAARWIAYLKDEESAAKRASQAQKELQVARAAKSAAPMRDLSGQMAGAMYQQDRSSYNAYYRQLQENAARRMLEMSRTVADTGNSRDLSGQMARAMEDERRAKEAAALRAANTAQRQQSADILRASAASPEFRSHAINTGIHPSVISAQDSYNRLVASGVMTQRQAAAALDNTKKSLLAQAGASKQAHDGISQLSLGTSSLSRLLANTAVVVQGFMAAFAFREILQANITMQQVRLTMNAVSGSAVEGGHSFSFAMEMANKYGFSIGELAKVYGRFLSASKQAGDTTPQIQGTFERTAASLRILGKSDADMEGVFRAFEQIKSKGTVMAEELRLQLGDRIPGAVQLMAKAVGVSTKELVKMMEGGQVSAKYLEAFSSELLKSVGGYEAAAKAGNTLQAEIGRLHTALLLAAEGMGKGGFNDAVRDAAHGLAEFFRSDGGMRFMSQLGSMVNDLSSLFLGLVKNVDLVGPAIAGLAAAKAVELFLGIASALRTATLAMLGFNAATRANPIGLIATGIGAAFTAFLLLKPGLSDVEVGFKKTNAEISDFSKTANDSLESLRRMADPTARDVKTRMDTISAAIEDATKKVAAAKNDQRMALADAGSVGLGKFDSIEKLKAAQTAHDNMNDPYSGTLDKYVSQYTVAEDAAKRWQEEIKRLQNELKVLNTQYENLRPMQDYQDAAEFLNESVAGLKLTTEQATPAAAALAEIFDAFSRGIKPGVELIERFNAAMREAKGIVTAPDLAAALGDAAEKMRDKALSEKMKKLSAGDQAVADAVLKSGTKEQKDRFRALIEDGKSAIEALRGIPGMTEMVSDRRSLDPDARTSVIAKAEALRKAANDKALVNNNDGNKIGASFSDTLRNLTRVSDKLISGRVDWANYYSEIKKGNAHFSDAQVKTLATISGSNDAIKAGDTAATELRAAKGGIVSGAEVTAGDVSKLIKAYDDALNAQSMLDDAANQARSNMGAAKSVGAEAVAQEQLSKILEQRVQIENSLSGITGAADEKRRQAIDLAKAEATGLNSVIDKVKEEQAIKNRTSAVTDAIKAKEVELAGLKQRNDVQGIDRAQKQIANLQDLNTEIRKQITAEQELARVQRDLATIQQAERAYDPAKATEELERNLANARSAIEGRYGQTAYANRLMSGVTNAQVSQSLGQTTQAAANDNFQQRMAQLSALQTQHSVSAETIAQQQRSAYQSMLQASNDWVDGAKLGMVDYAQSAGTEATRMAGVVSNAFKGMEDALVEFSMTGKLSFTSLANSIIKDLIRMQIQANITTPLNALLGNWISGATASTSTSISKSTTTFGVDSTTSSVSGVAAKGAYFDGGYANIAKFAKGGTFTNSIVSSPTLFKFAKGTGLMGEAGPEAIMPLQRAADGSLGVRANMSPLAYGPEAAAQVVDASNTSNITVAPNISVNVQGSASGNSQADSQFASEIASKTVREMRDSVRAIVADEINRAQKPGGMMNRLR